MPASVAHIRCSSRVSRISPVEGVESIYNL